MVDFMIAAVEMRLKDKDMALELTQPAKELLAKRGFDPVLGARPLRRTVQREIEDTLAEKMLYGEVRPGQIVLVDVEGEGAEAVFTFEGTDKAELPDVAAGRGIDSDRRANLPRRYRRPTPPVVMAPGRRVSQCAPAAPAARSVGAAEVDSDDAGDDGRPGRRP